MRLDYDKTAVLGDLATGVMNHEYFAELHPRLPSEKYSTVIKELRNQGYDIKERITDSGPEWFLEDPFEALNGGEVSERIATEREYFGGMSGIDG